MKFYPSSLANRAQGFTLVEVMVSISIFAMVMLMATGSVFSIVEANKKTHTLKSVMTNLNFALESMARDMRVGFRYACGSGVPLGAAQSCPAGDTVMRFKANRSIDGDSSYSASDDNDQIEYRLSNNRIMKKIYGTNGSDLAVTADEMTITSLKFYVTGTTAGDSMQPKAVITVQGYAGSGSTKSSFTIETTVTQRVIDS